MVAWVVLSDIRILLLALYPDLFPHDQVIIQYIAAVFKDSLYSS